jgi:predicted lipoprotein with Yx(FWY)xxD motif
MTVRKGAGALLAIAGAAIAAAGASAHATHSTTATATTARGATVKLAHTSKGVLLVGPNGHTLYVFARDGRNHDACVMISGCAAAWPPLTTSGKPLAGSGVRRAWLGTISIGGGQRQVTYNGRPLYYYAGDGAAAQTSYIGIVASGGAWYGLTASGKQVR